MNSTSKKWHPALWCAVTAFLMLLAPMTASAIGVQRNGIENLQVTQHSGSTVVKVDFKQPLSMVPANFSVANPARIVFDLPEVGNNLGRSVQQVNEGDLRAVNIVEVADRTRLVLSLKSMNSVDARLDGRSLIISLAPLAVGPAAANTGTYHFAETKTSEISRAEVRDVGFRRGKNGEGLITVDLSDPNMGIDVKQQGSNLVVEFLKVSLPDRLRRRLDVTDFATPVSTVNTLPQGENVRVVISPKGLWEHTAYQTDNQFVVEVKPLKEDPAKVFQGSQRQGYQGDKVSLNFQNIPVRELLHVFADITNFNIVVSDAVAGNVSLRLSDVPWDQALDIVLQQKGLAMRKNGNVIWIAPADELAAKEKLELESRQQISDLEPTRTESFQLNYQKADAIQKLLTDKNQPVLSKRGSAVIDQRSNKLFVNDSPSRLADVRRLITEIDVPARQVLIEARIVEADDTFSKSLGARLGGLDHRGFDVGHQLLGANSPRWGISGSAQDSFTQYPNNYAQLGYSQAQSVTLNADGSTTMTPQYNSDGTPIYVPSYNPNYPYRSSDGQTYPAGTYPVDGKLKRYAESDWTKAQMVNLPVAKSAGQFALTLFNSAKTQLLTLELSALEADGKGKTVSSPRVLTADQVEASIEDGKEIPYWSSTSSGATTISYRKATLSLKVRPQITPDGRVIMTLQVNKDNVDPTLSTAYGIAINTKNVKTEVLVENGGTVVIGGIYIQEERNTITRVPLLGDLPYVGFMFRNTDKSDNRRELLVFITPKIVTDTLTLR